MSEIPLGWVRQPDGSFSPPGAETKSVTPYTGVENEIPLHNSILGYCNSQWPKWKYIHANPAVKSTIGVGVHDITIFLPGRTVCIECKTRTGKLSSEQRAWAYEMGKLGHTVYLVRSFDDFLSILENFR